MSNQLASSCCCAKEPSDLQACCFENFSCDDLTIEECEVLGGTPQGVGTNCSDPGICVTTCVPCGAGGEKDCIEPWQLLGCPFAVSVTFSDVLLVDSGMSTECASIGGSVIFVGPICHTNGTCGYGNVATQTIGDSDCGGILTIQGQGFNDLQCQQASNSWQLRASLRCTCPGGQQDITVEFIWANFTGGNCVPLGGWGEGMVNQGGAEGSTCTAEIS